MKPQDLNDLPDIPEHDTPTCAECGVELSHDEAADGELCDDCTGLNDEGEDEL